MTKKSVKNTSQQLPCVGHAAPAKPLRTRRKEARPAELLQAATQLFVEKGYAATRVEEVAARAHVSKGTLFLYYPSKEALFQAVVRENIAGKFTAWQEELEGFTGTSAELVEHAFALWIERIAHTPAGGIYKMLTHEIGNFPELAQFYMQEVIAPGNALVKKMLQRGMARGEFRTVDVDTALHLITTPMFAYLQWRYAIGAQYPQSLGISEAAYFQLHIDNLLRGLHVQSVRPS